MTPTPDDLTSSQSEECPRADHALFLEHCKTPHYPLQGGTHSLEGTRPLGQTVGRQPLPRVR